MLPTSPESRAAFWAGVRDILIVSPSYVPFALVCGVAAANVGMSPSAALALPALVFGGSSQAVVLQFLMGASTVWIAVLSGLVVNLRMAIYSAAMAPKVRQLSAVKRMAAAAFLVDNAFAFIQRRETTHPEDGKSGNLMWYYTGLTCILWPNWVVFCGVGYLAGNVIPSTWQLDFAIPLSFIAMLGMHVHSKPAIAASVVGGLASGGYTIYDVQDFNRFRFSRDAAELLRHFDVIVWYNEGGALPLNLVAAVDPITAFLDAGHSMYLSALSVVGQDHILDGNFHRHYLGVDSTFCADVRDINRIDCNFTLTARVTVRSGNPAAPGDSLAVKGLGANVDFYTVTDSTVKELYVPYDQAGDDTTLNGYVRSDHICAVTRTLPSGGRVTFASLPLYKMTRFGNRDAVVTRLVGSIIQDARRRPHRNRKSR